jgi:hypothetical protein
MKHKYQLYLKIGAQGYLVELQGAFTHLAICSKSPCSIAISS